MLVEFSLTFVGKILQFMALTFLENALNLCMPQSPTQNSRYNFLKVCSPQDEKGGENYYLLYQNLIRKYKDFLEHYLYFTLFVILLNVMPVQFCN